MIELGQKVRVHYTGCLDSGREFDSSVRRGEPLEFIIGSRRMLPAFEKAVSELDIGGERTISIPPEQAYGYYDETAITAVALDDVPHANELPIGGYVTLSSPKGMVRVKVLKVEDDFVYFDSNHELAGKTLVFTIRLLAIVRESPIEQETHPVGCGCGCERLKQSLGV